jgi:hypothetical protein
VWRAQPPLEWPGPPKAHPLSARHPHLLPPRCGPCRDGCGRCRRGSGRRGPRRLMEREGCKFGRVVGLGVDQKGEQGKRTAGSID